MGEVKLDTKVKDAEVFVNGGYVGTTGDSRTLHLKPGGATGSRSGTGSRAVPRERLCLGRKDSPVEAGAVSQAGTLRTNVRSDRQVGAIRRPACQRVPAGSPAQALPGMSDRGSDDGIASSWRARCLQHSRHECSSPDREDPPYNRPSRRYPERLRAVECGQRAKEPAPRRRAVEGVRRRPVAGVAVAKVTHRPL